MSYFDHEYDKKITLPNDHVVDLRDEFVIEDVKYYVVEIVHKSDERGCWIQEVYLARLREFPKSVFNDPEIWLPRQRESYVSPEQCEAFLEEAIDNRKAFIRAEVEAMDWPNTIGE